MKDDEKPKLPMKRLSEEDLAARDFAVDFVFEEEFSEFFCIVDDGETIERLGNRDFLRMVLMKRKGWVIEAAKAVGAVEKQKKR